MMAKANKITEHQFLAGSQKARTLSRQAADISATTPILSLPTTPFFEMTLKIDNLIHPLHSFVLKMKI